MGEYDNQVGSVDGLCAKALDDMSAFVSVIDRDDYSVLYANDFALEFSGHPDEPFKDQTCFEFFAGRTTPCAFCNLPKMIETGFFDEEVEIPGSDKSFRLTGRFDEWNGRRVIVQHMAETTVDHAVRSELRQNREILKAAVAHSGLYLATIDAATGSATTGTRFQIRFGTEEHVERFPEDLIARNLIHPADVDLFVERIEALRKGKDIKEWDTRVYNPATREYEWLRFRFSIHFAADRRPLYIVTTAQNIDSFKSVAESFMFVLAQNGIWTWSYDIKDKCIINMDLQVPNPFGDPDERVVTNVPQTIIDRGIVHPDDISMYRELHRRLDFGADTAGSRIRLWNIQDKAYRWYLVSYTAVLDVDGKSSRAIGSARDISDQVNAEERFNEEVDYHKGVSDSLIAMCRLNITRTSVEEILAGSEPVDPSCVDNCLDYRSRITRVAEDVEISDAQARTLLPSALLASFNEGRDEFSFDFNAVSKATKEPLRIHLVVRIRRRPETDELVAFFYSYDITQEHFQSLIVDALPNFDYDMTGVLLPATGRAVSTARKGKTNLPALVAESYDTESARFIRAYCDEKDVDDLIDKLSMRSVIAGLDAARARRENVYSVDFDILEGDGSRRRKRMMYCYADNTNSSIMLVRSDVEESVRLEKMRSEQVARALDIAESASTAKGEFMARMSHEMRTPLNVIKGITELMRQDLTDVGKMHEYLSQLDTSEEMLLALINDVLDMAKIESGDFELWESPTNYADFKKRIFDIIRPLAEQKKIQLIEEHPEHEWDVKVDPTRFSQIFINLLSNAIKYTTPGGQIRFTCRCTSSEDRIHADFTVSDTGIGMSEEFQKTMFEPFSQERGQKMLGQQGTGLGLSIVKGIVDKMGGTVSCESEPGKGTTFNLRFDLVRSEHAVDDKVSAPVDSESMLAGINVLLAEDHPMNQLIASKLLMGKGATVVAANDGCEALETFRDETPGTFDAVLMDIRMPRMDGLEATRAIRALDRPDAAQVPIIAMTANAFEKDVESSFAAGMNAHLSKPIDPHALFETIRVQVDAAREQASE